MKIQAVHRGKQARKMLLKATDTVESAFKKFDTDGSGMLEAEELFQVLAELGLDVTDEDFIAYARALMEDYDSDGNGELDLEEFRKLYNQCLATAESRAAYAEELRSAVSGLVGSAMANVLEHQEMEAAATKIQAVHKGKQARKELQERKEMEAAAVKIQAVHRGKMTRMELREKAEQEAAALKIQAVHRGKMTRMELREKAEQEAAALKIQAVHRGKMTRMELREKAEQEAAALKIQAVHRGKMTRMELRAARQNRPLPLPRRDEPSSPSPRGPLGYGRSRNNKVAPAHFAEEDEYSEDEDYSAMKATEAASNLAAANPRLADALEAAAAVRKPAPPSVDRRDAAAPSPRARGGLSKHVVADLAQRLPSLCGGGRGGEMEALKLIAAVVATRRKPARSNRIVPL